MHASSGAGSMILCRNYCPFLFLKCVNSDCSGKIAQASKLAGAFAGHLCNK